MQWSLEQKAGEKSCVNCTRFGTITKVYEIVENGIEEEDTISSEENDNCWKRSKTLQQLKFHCAERAQDVSFYNLKMFIVCKIPQLKKHDSSFEVECRLLKNASRGKLIEERKHLCIHVAGH